MRSTMATTTAMRWIGAGMFVFLLAAASSCGGAPAGAPRAAAATVTPPPAPPVVGAARPSAASAPPAAWSALTKEARAQYMRDVIVPRMGELFRAFAPTKYAGFGCATYHGAGAADAVFTMPNPAQHPRDRVIVVPARLELDLAGGNGTFAPLAFDLASSRSAPGSAALP